MPSFHLHLSLCALFAVMLVMLVLWLRSFRSGNVSEVDVFWGPAFALQALVIALGMGQWSARTFLVLCVVGTWSLRLALHLHGRGRGKAEDRRYAAMRGRRGSSFRWQSLYVVFGLQAVLAWLISAPIQLALMAPPGPLQLSDWLGLALAATGLCIEATADAQLDRFRSEPGSQGLVMDRGLFRYSRHPNYFGDACLFWGLGLVALGVPGGWLGLFGPLLLTFFLLKVSGVSLLESDMAERRSGYADYVRRTSAFVPWFRR